MVFLVLSLLGIIFVSVFLVLFSPEKYGNCEMLNDFCLFVCNYNFVCPPFWSIFLMFVHSL